MCLTKIGDRRLRLLYWLLYAVNPIQIIRGSVFGRTVFFTAVSHWKSKVGVIQSYLCWPKEERKRKWFLRKYIGFRFNSLLRRRNPGGLFECWVGKYGGIIDRVNGSVEETFKNLGVRLVEERRYWYDRRRYWANGFRLLWVALGRCVRGVVWAHRRGFLGWLAHLVRSQSFMLKLSCSSFFLRQVNEKAREFRVLFV